MMNHIGDNVCNNGEQIENVMHIFYSLPLHVNLIECFNDDIFRLCRFKKATLLKILGIWFCIKKDRNTSIMLLSDFITGMWCGHKIGILISDLNLQ